MLYIYITTVHILLCFVSFLYELKKIQLLKENRLQCCNQPLINQEC